jgi:2-polyprenyl-3-methyl-5-hydroxy-6-metoxy-1,4-benzoquinol methylase
MDDRIRNEMAHGRKIADGAEEVWNWSGPAGTRRWRRRVDFLVGRIPPGGRVLEIGCGTGLLTEVLGKAGIRLTAIDVSPDLIRRAAARVGERSPVAFSVQNAYSAGLKDASFDAVVGISVLHHLELAAALAEFRRLLKPGGLLLFSEPNMMNPVIALQKNVPALKARAGDSPDETAFFRWPLARALRDAGFEVRRVEPFDFLHPATPGALVPAVERLGALLERLPGVREIGGSLMIEAARPAAR